MKFLCDQCKAKYQIADEKVQGKTLRMKCRKCGHIIEIRAADGGAGSTGDTMQIDGVSAEQALDALNKAKAPAKPAGKPLTTERMVTPGKPAPPTPKPGAAAPRPGGPTPKPGPAAPQRPGVGAPRPGAPRAGEAGKDGGALASAFSKNLSAQKKPEAAPPSSSHHADPPPEEWYAAIDEVPVGPIRLTDLRQKYAQGAVTDDSLVWREGFEEWRPLRTLPDLFQLVREEVSGAFNPPAGRNSLIPSGGSQAPKRPAAPVGGARGSVRPQATPAPAPVAARGNVIPFSPSRGGAAARKLDEEEFDDEATQIASAPVILPQPTAAAAARVEHDPFAKPVAPAAAVAPVPPAASAPMSLGGSLEEHPERHTMLERISEKARGTSKGTVALIAAAALLLGVVITVVLVKPRIVERVVEKRVEVPVSVQVPVATEAAPTASAEPSASTKVAWKGGPAPKSTNTAGPTPTTGGGSKQLGGLDLGPAGPGLGGPDPGGPPIPGASGALSGKDVESVVSAKRIGVRKQCYEPYADKGDANVTLTITVGPSGAVDSSDVSSSGPAGSLVGPCIKSMAKNWHFPSSGSGGTFAIPFIFKAG